MASDAISEAQQAIEEALALLADVMPVEVETPKRPALTVIKGGMA